MIRFVHGSPDIIAQGCVLSVGSFDGVHRGHASIVDAMANMGRSTGLPLLVASFDPHPRSVLAGEPERRLTSLSERSALLTSQGVDVFVCLRFDLELSRMEPEVFVEEVLVGALQAKGIVLGHDHRFGKGRRGDAALLDRMAAHLGFQFSEIGPVEVDGLTVSSSLIRNVLEAGEVNKGSRLLGHFHSLQGMVVHGAGRGRTIGVPTANIVPDDPAKLVPARGVYAVRVHLPDEGTPRAGMMNIGQRPTFDGQGLHLEVNVIDWAGDLYGREVRVEFVERVRDERKFDGVEALIRQLNADRDRCRTLLSPFL